MKMNFSTRIIVAILHFGASIAFQNQSNANFCPDKLQLDHHQESSLRFMEQEISFWRSEVYHRIDLAKSAVNVAVNRNNLQFLSTAITQTLGGLFDEIAYSEGKTSIEARDLVFLLGTGLTRGSFTALVLSFVQSHVEETCGGQGFDFVQSQFSHIVNNEIPGSHPELIKLKVEEFGVQVKDSLSCLIRRGVKESHSLLLSIDQLVFAMKTYVDLNQYPQ